MELGVLEPGAQDLRALGKGAGLCSWNRVWVGSPGGIANSGGHICWGLE